VSGVTLYKRSSDMPLERLGPGAMAYDLNGDDQDCDKRKAILISHNEPLGRFLHKRRAYQLSVPIWKLSCQTAPLVRPGVYLYGGYM
jgi:hypothetical protein